MPRVFSAVDISDGEVLEELSRVRDQLDLGFSPVEVERMHVTLQFFEDLGSEQIEEVRNALREVEIDGFQAELEGIGVFPSEEYIRVVWAGFSDEQPFHRLKKQVSDHGVEEDGENSFKPHVTLLRVRNLSEERKKKLQRALREFRYHGFGTFQVDSVKLFRSELTGDGPRYEELEVREL